MKKNILIILFICILSLPLITKAKEGDTFTDNNFTYKIITENTTNVNGTVSIINNTIKSLETLTIPTTVTNSQTKKTYTITNIESSSIKDNQKLKIINLSLYNGKVDASAFENNLSLEAINVDQNNISYKSIEGVLYTKDEKTLIYFPPSKQVEIFTISPNTTTIGRLAFSKTKLKNITISDSINFIEDYAFSNATSLEHIVFLSELSPTLGTDTFINTGKITSIYYPENSDYHHVLNEVQRYNECEDPYIVESPKTNDNIVMWIIVMIVDVICLIFVIFRINKVARLKENF